VDTTAKKRTLFKVTGLAGLLLVIVGGTVGAGEKAGNVAKILSGGTFGDVPFAHKAHQAALDSCDDCHDLFPEASGAVERLKAEGRLYSRQVMNQCTSCHLRRERNGLKTGPISCNGCHRD
jgi:hypothetical protein